MKKELKIVNLIHIGDKVVNAKDLTEEERKVIAEKLNEQALTAIGYRRIE